MEEEVLTDAQAKAIMDAKRPSGTYQAIIKRVKNGENVRLTGLTRGQVAAAYRAAKDAGIEWKTDYPNGAILFTAPTVDADSEDDEPA